MVAGRPAGAAQPLAPPSPGRPAATISIPGSPPAGSGRAQRKVSHVSNVSSEQTDWLADVLRGTTVEMVRREGPDLTARQLGVFLICYLESESQTVRGLAQRLDVSKPAITRALDRLTEFDLIARKADPSDRRSVLAQRTPTGTAFLREIKSILRDAASPRSSGASAARRGRGG